MVWLPSLVSWCDLASATGVHMQFSKSTCDSCRHCCPRAIEQCIVLVWVPSLVSEWSSKRTHNGLAAVAGVHVRFSKDYRKRTCDLLRYLISWRRAFCVASFGAWLFSLYVCFIRFFRLFSIFSTSSNWRDASHFGRGIKSHGQVID